MMRKNFAFLLAFLAVSAAAQEALYQQRKAEIESYARAQALRPAGSVTQDGCPVTAVTTPFSTTATLSTCIDTVNHVRTDIYSITGTQGQSLDFDYFSTAYNVFAYARGDYTANNFDICFDNFHTFLSSGKSESRAHCSFAQTGTYFVEVKALYPPGNSSGEPDGGPYSLTITGGGPVALPSILSFTASPTTVRSGQSATLSWVTSNASSVSIDHSVGSNLPASGTITVSPPVPTTYTLTAIGGGSATATVTVDVIVTPLLNIVSFPAPMLQPAGTGGATTSYVVTNAGGASTTVTITQSSPVFFTQTPTSFTLAPGATQTISITGLPQQAGAFEGASTAATSGSVSFAVPVKLLSAAPPVGTVTADAAVNRVDVAGASGTNPTGSVQFKNNGNATLTGILTSDVPWIIPQSGVVTIAPGQTVTLTFTIDRSKRPDPSAAIGSAEGSLTLTFLGGTGSPLAKQGPLDNTSVIPSVSLVKVIDTVQPTLSTAGIPTLASGEIALFVAGVGHTTSTTGKLFVSDVSMLNPQGSKSIDDVKLYYTPTTGNVSTARTTSLPSVPGQVSVAVADVVKNVFSGTEEVGTLHIRTKDADKLAVAATVLTTNNAAGTFGNTIPVFRSDRAAAQNNVLVLTGLRKDSTTHTNLYIQEVAGSDATVTIDYLGADGTTISSSPQSISAFKLQQLVNAVPTNAVAAMITNTSTNGAKIAAYATPLDEVSSDTWAIADWATQYGYAATDPVVVPIAGNIHGANNTFYRTDLAITNRTTSTATATLGYRSRTGSFVSKTINLGSKQTQVLQDVVGTYFAVSGDTVGFITVTPVTGSFAVASRTFATVGSKSDTFGTGVPSLASASALKNGGTRPIAGLNDANRTTVLANRAGTFRTNFALMETTGNSATVRVTFRFTFPAGQKAQGIGSAFRDYTLNGNQFMLLNSIAGEILGPARLQFGDLTNVEADFQVISGTGGVVLFTSSVDNATGDTILRTE